MKKKLNIFFSFILLLSFSWQSAAKTAIYLNFKKNQEQLAATVCENKDKPESCCQAKCYLEKEIQKEDKRQADSPASNKEKVEKTELKTGFVLFSFLLPVTLLAKHANMISCLPERYLGAVFHPPAK